MPTSSENDITGCEQSSVASEQPAADSQSSLPQGAQRHTGKFVSRGSPCAPLSPTVPPVVRIFASAALTPHSRAPPSPHGRGAQPVAWDRACAPATGECVPADPWARTFPWTEKHRQAFRARRFWLGSRLAPQEFAERGF